MKTSSIFLTCSETYSIDQFPEIYFSSILKKVLTVMLVNNHPNSDNVFFQVLIASGFSYSHIQLKIKLLRFKCIFLT